MIDRIRYIFLDFSDSFKNDFISTLKRSVWFLIIGIIAGFFVKVSPVAEVVCGLGIIIFGIFWARSITSTLTNLAIKPKNIMIKYIFLILVYMFCMLLGYAYFLWGLCKLIIIAIRKGKNNTNQVAKK